MPCPLTRLADKDFACFIILSGGADRECKYPREELLMAELAHLHRDELTSFMLTLSPTALSLYSVTPADMFLESSAERKTFVILLPPR